MTRRLLLFLAVALLVSGCVVRTTRRTPTIDELGNNRARIGPDGRIEESEIIWLWGSEKKK
ncbi:MAG TPA: hypothetical protein DCR55_11115 [Lentisphaeria bacterium]|nr:hypothetical protein [Lentisphaeria bacterium]